MKRVCQKSTSHCGPAVLEMLCSYLGVYIDQDLFVEAMGLGHKLEDYGMTVTEMGQAVNKLAPQLTFWSKQKATLSELSDLIRNYGFPVGVEWQGVFYEDTDEDNGHYSVVTHIDTVNNIITLSDPFKRFAGVDRQFHILEFQNRWWDENEIYNPQEGTRNFTREEQMMFVVTPKDSIFPESLGMVRG